MTRISGVEKSTGWFLECLVSLTLSCEATLPFDPIKLLLIFTPLPHISELILFPTVMHPQGNGPEYSSMISPSPLSSRSPLSHQRTY